MSSVLIAKNRQSGRRSQLTSIRNGGFIPGVVYGYNVENTPISINNAEFIKTMREVGRNGVISLDLEGKKLNVILHEYQEDPIKREVVHADFLAVDLSQEIEAFVRVDLIGEAAGAKAGGLLQQIMHEVAVQAKPDEIPEAIEVNVENLDIGETLTIADVRDQIQFTIKHEDQEPLASVQAPRTEEEETETSADEGETAEPTEE